MRDTAVLVTTFLRDDMLFRCVESIRQFYPTIPVFIGDNGRPSDEKTRFLEEHDCKHLMVTFDCGVSGVRNESLALIPKAYKYIFICEDDIVFTKETKLSKLRKVLDASPRVGIAAGLLRWANDLEQHYEATHWIKGDTKYVRKLADPEWLDAKGVKYCLCDLALNVFLMRRAVWDDVQWDAQFKTALEHADFFCSLKYKFVKGKPVERKKPWRVAYVPEVWGYHKTGPESAEYMKYRQRAVGFQLFAQKWGVRYSDSDYNKTKPLDLENYGKVQVYDTVHDRILQDAAKIMEALGLKWWLNSGSCLGAIRDKGFIAWDPDLDFGIAPGQDGAWNQLQDAFLAAGFTLYRAWIYKDIKAELSFKREDVKIDLFFYQSAGDKVWFGAFGPNAQGQWGTQMEFVPRVYPARFFDKPQVHYLRGVKCYVPSPPEEYLKHQYGETWRTPDKGWQYWRDNRAIDKDFLARPNAPAPPQVPAPVTAKPEDIIAVGIKTFMRAPTLYRSLEIMQKNCPPPFRLYIADDGPIDDEKRFRYQKLTRDGHSIIPLPFNCGISCGRNSIVKAAREKYILIADDDVVLADPESLRHMKEVLDAVPDIGLVAAVVRGEDGGYFCSEAYAKGVRFERAGPLLKRLAASQHIERVGEDGPLYVVADQVANFFLARRRIFDEVRWDDRIRIQNEHVDFFLQLQKTKWKAAVCLDARATHLRSNADPDYFQYRQSASSAYLHTKWGLTGIVNQL